MIACSNGHVEIARLLVEREASIDLQNKVSRAFSFSFIGNLMNAFLIVSVGGMECDGLCRMDGRL